MALALHQVAARTIGASYVLPQILQPFLRPSWSLPCEPSSSSTIITSPSPYPESETFAGSITSLFPSLSSLFDLFPSILLAAPKKKVSHSKKRLKLTHKWLKNKTNMVNCPACGEVKLMHHICAHCYGSISARWRQESRPKRLRQEAEETVRRA